MLSCSIWFPAPILWTDGGLGSCCVGRVYGADGAVHGTAIEKPQTPFREIRVMFMFVPVR